MHLIGQSIGDCVSSSESDAHLSAGGKSVEATETRLLLRPTPAAGTCICSERLAACFCKCPVSFPACPGAGRLPAGFATRWALRRGTCRETGRLPGPAPWSKLSKFSQHHLGWPGHPSLTDLHELACVGSAVSLLHLWKAAGLQSSSPAQALIHGRHWRHVRKSLLRHG